MATALVTGASGGIGRELSLILAREGYDIIAVARRAEELEALASEIRERYGRDVTVIPCDLTAPGVISSLPEDADVLINNAGFGDYGPFVECDADKQVRMIELNVRALTELTRRILPGMVARGKGKIMNVASVAAFEPGPLMSVYYATKAYVLSFSEALQEELRGTGVTVTALCPGPTNTGFAKTANADGANLFKEAAGADVRKVAEYGYRCMSRGKTVAVCGIVFKISVLFIRALPRAVVRRLIHGIQARTSK
jgi:hypothetical protein